MSSYLADRIVKHPGITLHASTDVTGLHGGESLEGLTLHSRGGGGAVETKNVECWGLFCFIGANPATEWLQGVAVDDHGFILTDVNIDDAALGPRWSELNRRPLPFETNLPCVFATGDVRAGSMKRVAAAVGEGASAVRSVHTSLTPVTV